MKEELPHYVRSSTALLALQPDDLEPKTLSSEAIRSWNVLKGHLERRLSSLRMWRNSWWNTNWNDLAVFLLPRRSIYLTQASGGDPTPNGMNRGRPLNNAIKDSTGTYAVRVCAAGLMSGLASPSRPWFKIVTKIKNYSPDAAGRAWIDEVESRIYMVLQTSNFYNSFAQECEDLVVFGTAPTIIYEDAKELIRCINPANGEYYLGVDPRQRVDCLYRNFVMTVSQIVDYFGIENCPDVITKLWNSKGSTLDQEFSIAHAIEPDFKVEGGMELDGNFTYREVYWLYAQGSKQPLSIRGFTKCPFTGARWSTQSNDAYGRSPGMDTLPDVKQLQVMTVRMNEAIEKQVRPPLLADIGLKNQPSSSLPGHVTYAADISGGKGMRPIYEVNPDIKGLSGVIEQVENRIKVGFFNDLFALFSELPGGKMTAYEASQKAAEKLQLVGPVIENLLTESLKPKLAIVYDLMQRKDMLPLAPPSMDGIPLDLEFVSILALAQKSAATGGLERIVSFIGNLAAASPDALDNLDVDKAIEEMNELLGNPNKILRGADDMAQIRTQRAQAQQQQQGMEAAQHVAQTASIGADAANTMANTNVGAGQSALTQLLGSNA